MSNKKEKDVPSTLMCLLALALAAALVAIAIWEVVTQIRYDGQYIEWRWIPLW